MDWLSSPRQIFCILILAQAVLTVQSFNEISVTKRYHEARDRGETEAYLKSLLASNNITELGFHFNKGHSSEEIAEMIFTNGNRESISNFLEISLSDSGVWGDADKGTSFHPLAHLNLATPFIRYFKKVEHGDQLSANDFGFAVMRREIKKQYDGGFFDINKIEEMRATLIRRDVVEIEMSKNSEDFEFGAMKVSTSPDSGGNTDIRATPQVGKLATNRSRQNGAELRKWLFVVMGIVAFGFLALLIIFQNGRKA